MGRKATGQAVWRRDSRGVWRWHARLTIPGRGRPFEPLEGAPWTTQNTPEAYEFARQAAAHLSTTLRHDVAVPADAPETVNEYAKRWHTWREAKGLACVDDDRTMLGRHVLEHIGHLSIRGVTRDDLKRLVAALDAKVGTTQADGKPFSWKTAVNAWSVVLAMFRDARKAKDPDLCVRNDNPTEDVAGPDVGPSKAKAYLWPSEFASLVTSEEVPIRWRRLFALAVYLYVRAGELAALEWTDVDLEHGTIHVHRSIDRVRKRKAGSTKTDTARRIPIEPALVPLLKALQIEAGGKGPVFRMPSVGVLSTKLKHYLRRAGVTRADLFTSDETRKAITFHDLRATGITWAAVRGDEALKIMYRAGHADFETTKIYLREAENLAAGFGEVFPALPSALLDKGPEKAKRPGVRRKPAKLLGFKVELTGIERVEAGVDSGNGSATLEREAPRNDEPKRPEAGTPDVPRPGPMPVPPTDPEREAVRALIFDPVAIMRRLADEAEDDGDYAAADAIRARARKLRAAAEAAAPGASVIDLASRRPR